MIDARATEHQIQVQTCNYLSTFYPDVIFLSDLSGIKLSIGLAKKIKGLKSSRGLPDLLILEPKNKYHGLLIEIKRDNTKVLNKSGKIPSNQHLQEQWRMITRLKLKGYYACFGIGYENCKKIIDKYMKGEL